MIGSIKRPQMFKAGENLFTKMMKSIQAFVPHKPKNLKELPTPKIVFA